MATINPVVTAVGRGDGSTLLVTWTGLTNADSCQPVSYPEYSDRSMHVSGTFSGASVAVRGSNNGTTYAPLNDPTRTVIAMTTETIQAVLENTVYVQPVATAGTGGQALTISMLFHLTNPLRT